MLNLWSASTLVPIAGDPGPWLGHAHRLIPDEADRGRVFDWLAFTYQHPGKKIGHALVFRGSQGDGKDTFLKPFWAAIGIPHNRSIISGSDLGTPFNSYLKKPYLLVSEMPSAHKRSFYEEMKPWLANEPDTIRINEKNLPEYEIPNIVNVIITTNHRDAIALADDDRRTDIIATQHASGEENNHEEKGEYFEALHGWLDQGGNEIVAGWLLGRDVSSFKPGRTPPRTSAKAEMTIEAAPPAVRWVTSLWTKGGPLENRVLVTVNEIMGLRHQRDLGANQQVLNNIDARQVGRALSQSGWVHLQRKRDENGTRQDVWVCGPVELLRQLTDGGLDARLEEDRRRATGAF
jgi:hypothetical protein